LTTENLENQPEIKAKPADREYIEIALSAIVLAVSFGIFFAGGAGGFSNLPLLFKLSAISLLTVSLGFILHELGHRFVAKRLGYIASYGMWWPGLLLSIATAFFSVIFASPGAVYIREKRSENRTLEQAIDNFGRISVAGPIMNLFLTVVFLLVGYAYMHMHRFGVTTSTLSIILYIGFTVNATLAAFNLIPFGFFDGQKIFRWNKLVWVALSAVSVGAVIFTHSSAWSIDTMNGPLTPRSFALYEQPVKKNYYVPPDQSKPVTGTFSIKYPRDWQIVPSTVDYNAEGMFNSPLYSVTFVESLGYAKISVQSYWAKTLFPNVDINEKTLGYWVGGYVKGVLNSDWYIASTANITISEKSSSGTVNSFEMRLQDRAGKYTNLYAFIYDEQYIYRLSYIGVSEYFKNTVPAYNELKSSFEPE